MFEYTYGRALDNAEYILGMRPLFNMQALFSDETENYVTPMEPEAGQDVTIRFRTAADNADVVYLVTEKKRTAMEFECRRGKFDYYKTVVTMPEEHFVYWFEIHDGASSCIYTKTGAARSAEPAHPFRICPGFKTPDWAKGAVMYQIYVDRFRNGDPSNDVLDREYAYINDGVSRVQSWYKRPAAMGVREFYGGDLQGVLDKLDYLQDLGVEVIYFNPLFVSPSNHKYDIQDYDHIDPHFGKIVVDEGEVLPEGSLNNHDATRYITRVTRQENLDASNQMFADLVAECHRRGMRVILDGVFNHCGSFNKWMDRERIYENQPGYEPGAHVSADSPYRNFFQFTDEHAWPYNKAYDGWWGHDTLPKLNYEASEKLENYILDIGRKWVSPPYNVDGWRLDVAADLGHTPEYNHIFWKKFRKAVREANPEAIILAEHYGDPSSWLQGDEWDTVMNYDAFMEPLTWFFTGMEKHSDSRQDGLYGNADSFMDAMRFHMADFMGPSLQVAMNELSNHDHSRFLTRTNRKVGRTDHFDYDAASEGVNPAVMREAVIMQMTWPGAPTVYYGDEAGLCGFTDPDNRRTYPWGHEDRQMLAFHKDAIAMHKAYPVLSRGSLLFLHGGYNTLAYARFDRKQRAVVVFNNNPESKHLQIPVSGAEIPDDAVMVEVLRSEADSYARTFEVHRVEDGTLQLDLPGYTGIVLVHEDAASYSK